MSGWRASRSIRWIGRCWPGRGGCHPPTARAHAAAAGGDENGTGVLGYVRIHDNDRFNIAASATATGQVLQSQRDVTSTNTATDAKGTVVDDTADRTLQPTSRCSPPPMRALPSH